MGVTGKVIGLIKRDGKIISCKTTKNNVQSDYYNLLAGALVTKGWNFAGGGASNQEKGIAAPANGSSQGLTGYYPCADQKENSLSYNNGPISPDPTAFEPDWVGQLSSTGILTVMLEESSGSNICLMKYVGPAVVSSTAFGMDWELKGVGLEYESDTDDLWIDKAKLGTITAFDSTNAGSVTFANLWAEVSETDGKDIFGYRNGFKHQDEVYLRWVFTLS